jgi:hypothetical protein
MICTDLKYNCFFIKDCLSFFRPKFIAMAEKPVKVDNWDGSALKNALDDAAKLVCISNGIIRSAVSC